MKFFKLIPYYLAWHYSGGISSFIMIWGNYLWFIRQYFSIGMLFKSFFRPYVRLVEKVYTESTTVYMISMIVLGVILRTFLILLGVTTYLSALILGFLLFLIFLILPIIATVLIVFGVVSVLNK